MPSTILAIFIIFLLIISSSFAYECGDINCSGGDPDISDITRIIDFLYLSHSPLCDPQIADVNGSGGDPDISDITKLIDNIYLSRSPLNCPPTIDCPETVTDIDGNVYQTVKIGDQCWMKENLKVTHYRNGDAIPNVTGDDWSGLFTGAYCDYDNNEGNVAVYGRLYNWYAVDDSRGLAPEGWHVPSENEWQTLADYLGGEAVAGGKMKEVGIVHWLSPNTGATNESGFTALPGGYRFDVGNFSDMNIYAIFWSSTEFDFSSAWSHGLNNAYEGLIPFDDNFKQFGFSVRCVKD